MAILPRAVTSSLFQPQSLSLPLCLKRSERSSSAACNHRMGVELETKHGSMKTLNVRQPRTSCVHGYCGSHRRSKLIRQPPSAHKHAAGNVDNQGSKPKRAAVLVGLFEDDLGDLRVILTKRSASLSISPGEVCLPGGKKQEGDLDDMETAVREAKEEIGLEPSLITIATVLKPFLFKDRFSVVPVIGTLPDRQAFTPVANFAEVEAVFDAPLEMFLKTQDESHGSEERGGMMTKHLIHYFEFQTENKMYVIWGLTASILIHAASVVYEQAPSPSRTLRSGP